MRKQLRNLKDLTLKPDLLCSIWIMNHEGVLRERYELYCKSTIPISYISKGRECKPEPEMLFEEFSVFMYENCAFAVEHNFN
jgi:hypothetical protein